jgi:hypothetical protein
MVTQATCSFSGCAHLSTKRGWCESHYSQWHRTGVLSSLRPRGDNDHVICEEEHTAWLILTDKAGVERARTCVDLMDLPLTLGGRWSIDTKNYVVRGYRPQVKLHRLLLGEDSPSHFTDHIDGDPLNNRRSNLRSIPRAKNVQNQARKGREHLRNVYFSAVTGPRQTHRRKPWYAAVMSNGKRYKSGFFSTAMEAAVAAKDLRAKHLTDHNEARHQWPSEDQEGE